MRRKTGAAAVVAFLAALMAAGPAAAQNPPAAQLPVPVLALSFDEMQGAKANDSSPANNDGAISGARWRADGRYGGALAFDGDDRVVVPDASSLDLTTRATFMAWVRPRTMDRWQTIMAKDGDAANGWNFSYGLYATNPYEVSNSSVWSGEDGVHGQSPLPVDKWSHVAATFDGTTWRLFRDGELEDQGSSRAAIVPSALSFQIGNSVTYGNEEGFDGLIDEVRVFGSWMSEAEIERIANTRIKSEIEEPVAPVLAMSFDDGAGSTVSDSSSYGNAGLIRGATWTTSGRFGKALLFDGTDDWVTVQDNPSLDLTNAHTVEAWVKLRRNKPWSTIITKEMGTNNMAYQLYASAWAATDGPIVQMAKSETDTSNFWWASGGGQLAVNRWYHVAYTFDGTNQRLYLDGNQVASSVTTGVPPTSDGVLRIGGNAPWDPNEYLAGFIDELRIYRTVLTPAQIAVDKETSIRSGARPGGDDAAADVPAPPAGQEPVASSAEAPAPVAQAPLARLAAQPAARRVVTTRKAAKRCRNVSRRVLVKGRTKARSVTKRVCAKPKKSVRRTAKRRSASGGR